MNPIVLAAKELLKSELSQRLCRKSPDNDGKRKDRKTAQKDKESEHEVIRIRRYTETNNQRASKGNDELINRIRDKVAREICKVLHPHHFQCVTHTIRLVVHEFAYQAKGWEQNGDQEKGPNHRVNNSKSLGRTERVVSKWNYPISHIGSFAIGGVSQYQCINCCH